MLEAGKGGFTMKFKVSENCVGCGACASLCPEVFHLTDAGVAEAIPGDVPQDKESAAEEALSNCPVGAIAKV
jgi:ferredoxin